MSEKDELDEIGDGALIDFAPERWQEIDIMTPLEKQLSAELERLRKIEAAYGPLCAAWDDLTIQYETLLAWAQLAHDALMNVIPWDAEIVEIMQQYPVDTGQPALSER